jgi:hypothetical protein
MQKQGFRESTIRSSASALKSIARNASLPNPEDVKRYLARAVFSESRKEKLADDLARFYHYTHIPFEKPRYRRLERSPFIPSEGEADQLISGGIMHYSLSVFGECTPSRSWSLSLSHRIQSCDVWDWSIDMGNCGLRSHILHSTPISRTAGS